MYDLLVRGGTVVSPTAAEPLDVAVEGEHRPVQQRRHPTLALARVPEAEADVLLAVGTDQVLPCLALQFVRERDALAHAVWNSRRRWAR